jgi:hypothetical protein
MDFMKDAEELAAGVAAVEGMKKLDPNAGFFTEAAAFVTGFEGAGAIADRVEEHKKEESGQ